MRQRQDFLPREHSLDSAFTRPPRLPRAETMQGNACEDVAEGHLPAAQAPPTQGSKGISTPLSDTSSWDSCAPSRCCFTPHSSVGKAENQSRACVSATDRALLGARSSEEPNSVLMHHQSKQKTLPCFSAKPLNNPPVCACFRRWYLNQSR